MTSRITVIGAGTVGANLATAFDRLGHKVRFAARSVSSEKVKAVTSSLGAEAVELRYAAQDADLVVVAVPFQAVGEVTQAFPNPKRVPIVDATNAVGSALPDGADTVVDVIDRAQPGVPIVKAFNTIGAEALLAPAIAEQRLFLPIAGDEPAAGEVADLAREIGFDAMVIGDRGHVRLVEDFAQLWIRMAFGVGAGRDFGFARVVR